MIVHKTKILIYLVGLLLVSCLLCHPICAVAYPIHFKDSRGIQITISKMPSRVVSLVPSITEMSADTGRYYEPGTINIIILPNMKLSERAMTRAIITATEAKTAALMDLDVRSHQSPKINQATGTGTDNMIVVQGSGIPIDNTGGHSKMGELIAKAVYAGVKEAIYKQNGIVPDRNIFQRLRERRIDLFGLVNTANLKEGQSKASLMSRLEEVLLDPHYASFLETAMALNDAYEKGSIHDLSAFRAWCVQIAEEISGQHVKSMVTLVKGTHMPRVLGMALNSLLNGVCANSATSHEQM